METGNCTVAGKDQDQVGYMACVPCVLVLGTGSNSIKKIIKREIATAQSQACNGSSKGDHQGSGPGVFSQSGSRQGVEVVAGDGSKTGG